MADSFSLGGPSSLVMPNSPPIKVVDRLKRLIAQRDEIIASIKETKFLDSQSDLFPFTYFYRRI